jgi:hypothetical protein
MRPFTVAVVFAALLISPGPSLYAETAADPSGHWEGSVQIPGRELTVEVDLIRNAKGELLGTMNNPAENIKGVPLRSVVVDGRSVSFNARRDQPFTGMLSADGKSMFGEYTLSGYVLPFSMSRTGDAEIIEPARSIAVGKALEGSWNGTLNAGGKQLRLVLKMSNRADGTAAASIVSLDEGELEIPVTIAQTTSGLTLDASMTGASYAGALNADGTELTGTFTQREFVAPLTFRLAKP